MFTAFAHSAVQLSAPAVAAAHVVHGGWGFWWLGLLIPLFWILVFVLVFGVFGRRWRRRAWEQGGHFHSPARSAEASLAERFAQGDIDEKEYRARLEVLRANAPTQG
jgi:putative membrane protein